MCPTPRADASDARCLDASAYWTGAECKCTWTAESVTRRLAARTPIIHARIQPHDDTRGSREGSDTVTAHRNRISVVGLGFVGTSLAAVNARAGFDTIGVDSNGKKIDELASCRLDFFEPDVEKMLRYSVKRKKVHFTTDLDYAMRNSEITFLTVGTPLKSSGDGVDLSHVKRAVTQIARSLRDKKDFHLLAVKSTVPPLTTENTILPILKDLVESGRADVVVNPEFLREGSAVSDLLKPNLIVIGSSGDKGPAVLERHYRDFYDESPEIMHTSISTAELIKYANNAFLATKISFINFVGSLCQSIPGSDVNTVARAIGKDPRIGPLFLQAGTGFGGSCLTKDLTGLIKFSQRIGKDPNLIKAVRDVNDRQFGAIMEMIRDQGALVEGNTISILGLAFKGGTDDVRNSMSVRIVERLLEYGLKIKVHDPLALENFEQIFGAKVLYCTTINECLENSDCCAIMTDWDAYRVLAPRDFLNGMRSCNIIDARRVLDAGKFQGPSFKAMGFGGEPH